MQGEKDSKESSYSIHKIYQIFVGYVFRIIVSDAYVKDLDKTL